FLDASPRELEDRQFLSGQLRRPQVDELPATEDQLLQFRLLFRRFFLWRRERLFSEPGQDPRVDLIVLGQQAQATSEVTDSARVDDGYVVAGLRQVSGQAPLVTSSRLHHDQTAG